jgi:hypothetical protein
VRLDQHVDLLVRIQALEAAAGEQDGGAT